MIKVGINGFGRIGRSFFRALLTSNEQKIQVVAINFPQGIEQLIHLLKYDSTYGRLNAEITHHNGNLVVNGHKISFSHERDPKRLRWADVGADVIIESTGAFTNAHAAYAHIEAGAKKVIISAPAQNEDLTIVMGVNHHQYDPSKHHIISIASCTTNCLAPMLTAVNNAIKIEYGMMTTVHAYTRDQNLQDNSHSDLRRARAAAINIIPTSTGAAKAIGLVIPELNGKIDGYSLRVPVITGSLVDCTVNLARDTSVEEINAIVKHAAENQLKGILSYTEEPIVSTDIIGDPSSSIFDSKLTKVIEKRQVKLVSWYDNEWGFSNRLIDAVKLVVK